MLRERSSLPGLASFGDASVVALRPRFGPGLSPRSRLRSAELLPGQDRIAVDVEHREPLGRAGPFRARDAAVVVRVQTVEAIAIPVAVVETVVSDRAGSRVDVRGVFAEKLRPRKEAVAVGVGSAERLDVGLPLFARDSIVAVAIEGQEAANRPVVEVPTGRAGGLAVARSAGGALTNLLARQDAVLIPVVHLERPIAAVPLSACDHAVLVHIQGCEAHRRPALG